MNLKEKIRVIQDFPEKGISFKDITPLLQDKNAFKKSIDCMKKWSENLQADIVVGPEARGFIFATALAYALNVGFVPVRKPGKLPGQVISAEYSLEYGKNILEIHKDAIQPGQKVVIVDDLLATGGTLLTTARLIERLGGQVVGIFFLIELSELKGRETLKEYNVKSLITY
ncbi:adenine phosphoribosyltransferase [Garciella nitratireducens]|uniref:Adenine phosphoribosyltransferase n=1 Tax=Garciella nitratireducens DSM 15102 TaxID=1121911 RepID=A0A1T4K0X9_9FIRM|nr:adenine phosphoribosyltransferase [Garciella nitratireducens]RBP35830.1 adenine phosphoribosyltransferase [Garciella nitratireducens]SJZ36136.1 adenine phosphoribosyltransferase [Garciella nitratireducens DSM 15102]